MFWPGTITVEHKSKGKDLAAATEQCLTYLHDKPDHEWPKAIVTSDFARIRGLSSNGTKTSDKDCGVVTLPEKKATRKRSVKKT